MYSDLGHWTGGQLAGAGVLLGVVTFWVVWRMRAQPFLAVGWFWFLGMLVPVIGLVQVGEQSMADRYTYVPSVGLFIMAIWWLRECTVVWLTRLAPVLAGVALMACAALTVRQVGYWKDSWTLYSHAAAVTDNNYLRVLQSRHLLRYCRAKGRRDWLFCTGGAN